MEEKTLNEGIQETSSSNGTLFHRNLLELKDVTEDIKIHKRIRKPPNWEDKIRVMIALKPSQPVRKKTKCKSCDAVRIWKNRNSYIKNKKILAEYECKNCIRQRIKESLDILYCDLCDFQSRVKKKFIYHIESHMVFKCDACQKIFKTRNSLKIHLKSYFEHFICHRCGITFKNLIKFKHHVNRHDPDFVKKSRWKKSLIGEFQCKFCPLIFKRETYCLLHESRIHKKSTDTNPFQCKVCEKIFYQREDLRLHSFEHYNGKLRFCDFPNCTKFFKKGKSLTSHKRSHYPPKYTCVHCGKQFVQNSGMLKHIREKRCELLKPIINENKPRSEEEERKAAIAKAQYDDSFGKILTESNVDEDVKDNIIYDSDYNDFKDEDELTTIEEEIVDGGFTEVVVKVEPLDNWESDYQDEFAKSLINPFVLLERMEPELILRWTTVKTEPEEVQASQNPNDSESSEDYFDDHQKKLQRKPRKLYSEGKKRVYEKRKVFKPGAKFVCDKCGKDFCHISNIRRHIKDVHPAEDIVCDICNVIFKTRGNYNRHYMRKHLSIKAFICHICARAFYTSYGLKGHIKSHDQPCECKICGKMVSDLKTHLNRHNSKKAEIVYVTCPQCGKLLDKYQLQIHIDSVHTKVFKGKMYHCDTCYIQFTRREDLRRHTIEDHYQDKLFTCHCGQVFKKSKALKTHKVSHNPHNAACKSCGKIYATKGGLRKHMRQKHQEFQT